MSDLAGKTCGVVMPISTLGDYSATHWSEVLEILSDAIEDAGFKAALVSDADEVGVIHRRIIQNLYENPIVVCDVSGKNSNVMFELGMRLAFDKPTIIVKDNATSYSFDTSAIEHLEYPRDLRFNQVVAFKEKLKNKIKSTCDAASSDPNYSTFLKHFGDYKVAKIDQTEVSGQEFIIDEIRALRTLVERQVSIGRQGVRSPGSRPRPYVRQGTLNVCMRGVPSDQVEEAAGIIRAFPGVVDVRVHDRGPEHAHILAKGSKDVDLTSLGEQIYQEYPH